MERKFETLLHRLMGEGLGELYLFDALKKER